MTIQFPGLQCLWLIKVTGFIPLWLQELELGSHVLSPKLVTSLKELDERVVQVSLTNTAESCAHTIVLTESGNLFSFGRADNGQLGAKLSHGQVVRQKPGRIHINLS